MEFIEAIDQGAVHPFRHVAAITALRPLLIGMAYLGEMVVLLAVLLLGVYLLQSRRQTRAAWLVALTTGVAALVTYGSKQVVDRAWPNVVWTPLPVTETKSFPSGHALLATVVYGSLGAVLARRVASRRTAITLRILAVLLPFLAGLARLLVGHNYVTDVLAGWAAGVLLVLICVDLDKRGTEVKPQAAGEAA
jgi:undecaprenyl-diphosphatase